MKINFTLDTSSHTFRTIFTLSLFLFAMVLLGSSAYSAWTNPPSSPPNSNVDAPVNVGSTSQIKSGPLQVNGFLNSGSTQLNNQVLVRVTPSNIWALDARAPTYGVYGQGSYYGVYGESLTTGYGVVGNANDGYGVTGSSVSSIGVRGTTGTSYAGYFTASGSGGGVFAQNGSGYYAYLGYPGSSWGVYTNGSIYAAASSYATAFYYNSDESLKENVAELDGLDIIKRLRGVSFTWKETGEDSVGLIAQEVEKVLPELVSTDSKTGLKSVQYGNIVGPLIEAVKEQQTEIDELKSELKALSEKVDALSK
jgi:hypothetical protein